MKPKLGRRVYCIYNEAILVETVAFIGQESFIVSSFGNDTNEDSWEWWYEDFEKTWFTSISKAKKCILSSFEEKYGCKFKLKKLYEDYYEVMGVE